VYKQAYKYLKNMKNICQDKSKLNLSIDIILFLLMMPIVGIGLLIKYVLIPGVDRNKLYGNNVDLEFWGLARHQWGTIHLILGIVFLGLLLLHLILHWKMIVCIFKRMFPNLLSQVIFAFLFVVFGLIMLAFPLFVKPELTGRMPLHQNRVYHSNPGSLEDNGKSGLPVLTKDSTAIHIKDQNQNIHKQHREEQPNAEEYEVNGRMTLQYVAEKYGIPVSQLAADLNIPEERAGETLGRLKKIYSITMSDVKNCISKRKKK